MAFINIEIHIEDDAFHPDPAPEVERLLREMANDVKDAGVHNAVLYDVNGNRVGHLVLVEGEGAKAKKPDPRETTYTVVVAYRKDGLPRLFYDHFTAASPLAAARQARAKAPQADWPSPDVVDGSEVLVFPGALEDRVP